MSEWILFLYSMFVTSHFISYLNQCWTNRSMRQIWKQVLKFLERDSIAWTEEENGTVLVIRADVIDPRKMTFAKKSTARVRWIYHWRDNWSEAWTMYQLGSLWNASAFFMPTKNNLGSLALLQPKGFMFYPLVFLLDSQAGEQALVWNRFTWYRLILLQIDFWSTLA